MDIFIVLFLVSIAAWFVFSTWSGSRRRLPPGPPRLPIFGNIFQLGLNPHKSLAQLAKTYGPLMSLKLGTQYAVVVSSPEMATEVLQKQGLIFSNRSIPEAARVHAHDQLSINGMPSSSDGWKRLRRISREKLFSNPALHASQELRQERLRKLADYIGQCSEEGRVMNVGQTTFTTMLNFMFATLFSIDDTKFGAADSAANKELKEHVNGFTRYLGVPNVADFFPIFLSLDPQGVKKKVGYHLGKVLDIVDGIIHRRLQERGEPTYQKRIDFLETLLDLVEGNEFDLSIDEIKHLCLDLVIAGSDTSAATTEWAMTELLLHPNKLAKVREELKSVVGSKRIIEESDISQLPYLQATIKEVLRYHPVAPLLGPRVADEEAEVNGYIIPKNSKLIVNFWAIGRDPSIWKDPERFEPERFFDKNIDFGGTNFELIPFGAGRRICPGLPLANRMLHCMVATLCHNFDWKLQGRVESNEREREGVFGIVLQKKSPLRAIPIKV